MKSLLSLFLSILLGVTNPLFARQMNGFNLDNAVIPSAQILSGGPPKDGIPSIDNPKFIAADKVDYLKDSDRIMGVVVGAEARAYPIKILNWHEIVNDSIKGKAIAVTFCPLCGSGVVYDSTIDGKIYQFGVSGLLYNSDVLLYDRQTESLWSQILSKGISGKMVNKKLSVVPSSHTSWKAWRLKHPDSKVLSTETGYSRDYNRSPYAGYTKNSSVYFPLAFRSKKYHPKERVLGLSMNGKYKAYPFSELAKAVSKTSSTSIHDKFAGKDLTISVDIDNRDGEIHDASGKLLIAMNSFWFAWYAFHPDTEVYKP